MIVRINARFVRAFFCLPLAFALAAAAAGSPSPLRIVVPAFAGGSASLQAGTLAEVLGRADRPVVVDHRDGFGAASATAAVAGSPADGGVLLLGTASLAVRAAGDAASDEAAALRRLKPVGQLSATPLVLAVHPRVPSATLAELSALSRSRSVSLQGGAPTAGGLGHLAAAMLLPAAPAARIAVYRGSGPALRALVDGQIDLLFAAAPAVLPHWVAGRLRMLAVTAESGHAALARLPRLDGAADSAMWQWYGLFAPPGTADGMVRILQKQAQQSLSDGRMTAFFAAHAVKAAGTDAVALEALLQRELARYAQLMRRAAMVP